MARTLTLTRTASKIYKLTITNPADGSAWNLTAPGMEVWFAAKLEFDDTDVVFQKSSTEDPGGIAMSLPDHPEYGISGGLGTCAVVLDPEDTASLENIPQTLVFDTVIVDNGARYYPSDLQGVIKITPNVSDEPEEA